MKPFYEEKNEKVIFRFQSRDNISPLTEKIISIINKSKKDNSSYCNIYKEKQLKNSEKIN